MKKFTYLIFICIFTFSFSACSKIAKKKLCFKDICIMVEIADNDYARGRGLMLRSSLAPDEGMLFAFDKDVLCSMWMKNMRFPLDMLWVDQNKKIVHLKKNVPPCTSSCEIITPPVSARYVIEVNAGFTDRHQIKIADTVVF